MTPSSITSNGISGSAAIVALAAALGLAVVGCGSKPPPPAPVVAAPTPAPAPAAKPPLPYGPEAQKTAIDRAAAFAQTRYPDKLQFTDAIAVYESAPPPAPAQTGVGARPPAPIPGPGMPPPPPPSQAEREAMISGKAPTGEIPIAPPPTSLPTMPKSSQTAKGSWKVMFRLLKPVSVDPATPPITVRVFTVDGGGKVAELEPMTIPLSQLPAPRPAGP